MIVDAEIEESIREGLNFGMESTYSGLPGPDMVKRVVQKGYRVEGLYFGTADPNINIERIEHRVFAGMGHAVAPARVPDRRRYSLANLRRTAERFDLLRLFDNSERDEFDFPGLVEQCRLKRGKVSWQIAGLAKWRANWLQGLAQRRAELRLHEAKLARATQVVRNRQAAPFGPRNQRDAAAAAGRMAAPPAGKRRRRLHPAGSQIGAVASGLPIKRRRKECHLA